MSGAALRQRLVETAAALTEDFPSLPAGSVLRCYARAVARARLAQCPAEELPEVARLSAARLLAERAGGCPGSDRVPAPPPLAHPLPHQRVGASRGVLTSVG